MKVVFQYQGLITDGYKEFFKANVPDEIQLIFMENQDDESLFAVAEETDLLVGYRLNESFLAKAKNLKHIQIPWTGFNNLGVEYLKGREHITVSNSHSNSLAIAEHAVALLLSASKLITHRDSEMRKNNWSTRYSETNSFWVTGKTLGIIGYGAIGKKVATIMKSGFNMRILAIKRNPTSTDDFCDFLGTMQDIDKILIESDFILVAVPLTKETERMINASEISKMKSNAILVNIARGPIIEEEALFQALKEHRIGAAGIDAWYNYPKGDQRVIKQNYPFGELDNIVMTPHSAFKIRDREEIFAQDILTNIFRVFENKEPINRVNLQLGY